MSKGKSHKRDGFEKFFGRGDNYSHTITKPGLMGFEKSYIGYGDTPEAAKKDAKRKMMQDK
jgi:hypothetical protein